MKFITEIHLRDLYKNEPFTSYKIEPDIRLTPGARQFLIDHGIKILDTNSHEHEEVSENKNSNLEKEKLLSRMKSVEALFLLTAEEFLTRDVILSQRIIKLSKQFTNIKSVLEEEGSIENLYCNECTGINEENFSDNLDDCFEITDFHIQLDRGREIIILHRLRCNLGEIRIAILEFYKSNGEEDTNDVISKINQIINTLSQIICSIVGGKRCQRKN